MTPPALPSLPGLAWSRHKKPGFSTRVASHVSGREVRVALMSYPLYEFEAVYAGLASAPTAAFANLGASSLQSLMGFFLQLLGQAGVFLYTDPDDNAVTGGAVGTGDGSTQAFLFTRNLGGFAEPVGYVTAVSDVYLSGVAQASSSWVFSAPNMLGFATAPGAGVAITADFTFAFQCRFLDDQIDFEEFMSALWKLDKLAFRSIKANASAAGAAIPSWYTPYAIAGTNPYVFADFTTEGVGNHYLYSVTTYPSFAALLTALGGSFSRASSGYYTNASGLLASAPSNVPRFDHDGSGNPKGILLEGASANLIIQSQFASAWTTFGATLTANAATAPDGTATAAQLADSSASGGHGIFPGAQVTTVANTTYAVSVYAKQGTGRYVAVMFSSYGGAKYATGVFDLGNSGATQASQTATGGGATLASTSQVSIGNGWWRLTVAGSMNATDATAWVATAGAAAGNSFAATGYPSYAGSGQYVYIWGCQEEALSFASSYIPTTSSTATRAADSLYFPWTATTFTARVGMTMLAEQDNGRLLGAGSGGLMYESSGPSVTTSNGTNTLSTGVDAWNTQNIVVLGGSPSGRVLSANGNAATNDGNALVPSAPSNIYVGEESGGSNYGYGHFAQLGLYTVAATAAQAAALSGTA